MTKSLLKQHFIFEKRFLKTVLAIAVPIALQNMISFGVNVMDSVMLGSLGDVAISAANLGGQPFSILMSLGFGLSSGAAVLIAQYWGKKDIDSIREVMCLSMQVITVVSVLFTALVLLFPVQIMGIYTKEPEIIKAAVSYLTLIALSYIPYSISSNYMMNLRGVEQVKVSTCIYGVSFFVNVFFNYVFIFGKFGAPRLEVRGAAVGTVLARWSELIMVLFYMYGYEKVVKFHFGHCFHRCKNVVQSYVTHSLPVVGNELLWGIGFSVTSIIMGHIGTVFVAAHSIGNVLNQLTFVSIVGVANAAAVLTGKTIGEGHRARAQKVANTLLVFSVIMGMFNCIMMLLIRPAFLSIYKITPETYAAAYSVIGVLALLQLVLGVDLTCIVGVLRGGGDCRTAFVFDCGALWCVSIPMGILTGLVLKLPVPLVYIALKLDSPIKAFLGVLRIRSGKWIRNVTVQNEETYETIKINKE